MLSTRKYPDNELRVASLDPEAICGLDSVVLRHSGYYDIRKQQSTPPEPLSNIRNELWCQFQRSWPEPPTLPTPKELLCVDGPDKNLARFNMFQWVFLLILFLIGSIVDMNSDPNDNSNETNEESTFVDKPWYISLVVLWTFSTVCTTFCLLKRCSGSFLEILQRHIDNFSPMFEEEGYYVDCGCDGKIAPIMYVRFRKIDGSDFDHIVVPKNCCCSTLHCLSEYGLALFLFIALLVCPAINTAMAMGTHGLVQVIDDHLDGYNGIQANNNTHQQGDTGDDNDYYNVFDHYNIGWSPVTFSQRFYWNPDHPTISQIFFSHTQKESLGMEDEFALAGKFILATFVAFICYIFFLFRIPCLFQSFMHNLVYSALEGQDNNNVNQMSQNIQTLNIRVRRSFCFGAISFFLIPIFAILPDIILKGSSLCGPYFIELPFEMVIVRDDVVQYHGIDTIDFKDISVTCIFGSDFYWKLGLGCLSLLAIPSIWILLPEKLLPTTTLDAQQQNNESPSSDDEDNNHETMDEEGGSEFELVLSLEEKDTVILDDEDSECETDPPTKDTQLLRPIALYKRVHTFS